MRCENRKRDIFCVKRMVNITVTTAFGIRPRKGHIITVYNSYTMEPSRKNTIRAEVTWSRDLQYFRGSSEIICGRRALLGAPTASLHGTWFSEILSDDWRLFNIFEINLALSSVKQELFLNRRRLSSRFFGQKPLMLPNNPWPDSL